jgi:hypothetical protein
MWKETPVQHNFLNGRCLVSQKTAENINIRGHHIAKFFTLIILICLLLTSINIGSASASHAKGVNLLTHPECDPIGVCAQAKASDFIIYLPWDDGITHKITKGYGPVTDPKLNTHVGICRTDKTNDYYALDFDLKSINDKVRPIATGTVEFAGTGGTGSSSGWTSYGNMVIIDHLNGYHSLYAHLSKIEVRKGDPVNHSTVIGYAGNSGGWSEIHLHFALYYGKRSGYSFIVDEKIKGFYGGCATVPEPFRGTQDYEDLVVGKSLTSENISSNASVSSTALVFDTSGSMQEADASGSGSKIQAAKSAGERILDIISAENKVPGTAASQVALIHFDSSAQLIASLSADMQTSRTALGSLIASGRTDMPDGLKLAIDSFQGTTASAKKIILLLSDGMPNVGLGSNDSLDEATVRQQVLDLATQAGKQNICIYTIGFGDPAGVGDAYLDESFLKQVSANAGCGSYYNARNAIQLADVYVQLRHSSTGNVLLNQTGRISQGQLVDMGTANIPSNQALALFTLNWPGSRLDALLTDPTGKLVDNSYPGATISTANSIVSIILQNPKAGQWKIAAQGVDVPEGTTDYNAILSVRPNTATAVPPSSGIPIVLLIVAGGGVLVYAISRSNRRATPALRARPGYAYLVGLSGAALNQTFPLSDGALIGRGSTCRIRLTELSVSRQHARLRVAQGAWFIQDLNSTYGTYVNGQRISATRLKDGDRIRIGSTELEFRM